MKNKIAGFPPIVDMNSKVLILGSIPGIKSLEVGQYYGHSQNHFWKIILMLTKNVNVENYCDRVKILKAHNIALWDVIYTCQRNKTSSDSMIKNAKMNDLYAFLKDYPNIQKVFCNGKTSLALFKKNFPDIDLPIEYLPSTSPAYAKSLDWKLKQWRAVIR